MVSLNPDTRLIRLSNKEQLTLLQYCTNIPTDIHQMIFSAQNGMLTLTLFQCDILRSAVEIKIDRISNDEAADTLGILYNKLCTNPVMRKIGEKFNEMSFDTIEQVQAAADKIMNQHNNAPDPALGGLSPVQTYKLFHTEWDKPDCPMKLNKELGFEDVANAPLYHNAVALMKELIKRENEATATEKGNLSRKVAMALLDTFRIDSEHVKAVLQVSKTVNEYDVMTIWSTRLVCQQAELIRKHKNKFVVTKQAAELLNPENSGKLYNLLFITYLRKFKIGFYDRLPDIDGLQQTISYTLYHLNRLAKNEVGFDSIYSQIILPAVIKELKANEGEYLKSAWIVKLRVIEPLEYAGLLDCKREKIKFLPEIVSLKISPLFQKLIRFEF